MSVFIRWADGEEIREDILCMEKLEGKTTGKLALALLKIALEKFGLNLKNMVGVTTDGVANMVGKNIGLHGLLKKELPDCMFLYCMIHRNALEVGVLPDQFTTTLNMVVSINNKIKMSALYTRQFKTLCEIMELILCGYYIIQR